MFNWQELVGHRTIFIRFPIVFFIQGKQGYVYVNVSNKYILKSAKKIAKNSQGYTDHESICIGVLVNPAEGKNCQTFYANDNYRRRFLKENLPVPPAFADSLSVGLHEWISKAATDSGLIDDLCEAFDEEEVELILDLASYMMSAESAVMQHYPAWARNHVIFSEKIVDDNVIGRFLKSNITLSRIRIFREKMGRKKCWKRNGYALL